MKFYGLFGEHLSHSFSPEIHKEIYRLINLDAAYKLFPFPSEEIRQALDGVRTLSISGVNVTIPYKEKVIPFLDDIHIHAKQLKSVNTIHHTGKKLIGYNTDYAGFALIFEKRKWVVQDQIAVVLGTGGAAKVAIQYLKDQEASQIYVVSRSPENHESDSKVQFINYSQLEEINGSYLINTTPVGMFPNQDLSPVDQEVIQNFDVLIDLIYNPYETKFLTIGKSLDKQIVNGMDMLVGQAVRAVEIWEDISISHEILTTLITKFNQRYGGKL